MRATTRQCPTLVTTVNLALRLGIETQAVFHLLTHASDLYASHRQAAPALHVTYHTSDTKVAMPICRAVVHGWVIFNASACCPGLCQALAGQQEGLQRIAETVLNGSLESLQRSKAAQGRPDPRQRFV